MTSPSAPRNNGLPPLDSRDLPPVRAAGHDPGPAPYCGRCGLSASAGVIVLPADQQLTTGVGVCLVCVELRRVGPLFFTPLSALEPIPQSSAQLLRQVESQARRVVRA